MISWRQCVVVVAGSLVAVTASGMGHSQASQASRTSAPAGTVAGRVTFMGTPPPRGRIRMESDPGCVTKGDPVLSEEIIVADGGVENVFVSVKDGLGQRVFPTPTTPAILQQEGCRYMPHVLGVQVGQPLEIINADPLMHNIHALPRQNAEFNFSQPARGLRTKRVFKTPEMVPIKCDVHRWMSAFVGVSNHPFFAVSRADGTFEITGLPPGAYAIEAWHERLGTRTQQVTIDDKTGAVISFTMALP